MLGCDCLCWSRVSVSDEAWAESFCVPKPFSFPSPLPSWPQGEGFATGTMGIGELEISHVSEFEKVWSYTLQRRKNKGVAFYKPRRIPDGFFSLGYYVQPDDEPLRGFLLVVREVKDSREEKVHCTLSSSSNPGVTTDLPAIQKPLDYTLVWSRSERDAENDYGNGYFWLPCPPDGYKAMGYVVTNTPNKPSIEEVKCVRADLTEDCEAYHLVIQISSFQVWKVRPCHRGMWEKGVAIGTFFCTAFCSSENKLSVSCLRNVNSSLGTMPNVNQIHALIKNYGPTIFFHPDEIYLPSAVSWFFENGALLYRKGFIMGETIDSNGSNLPSGGSNDGEYWIDLPNDDRKHYVVKLGNIERAEVYAHVKPALGGSFTDIAMWVFCPFNGPATLKIGVKNLSLGKIGQHVGDWEHFTLRINNFTGELWSIYFSQHSGGEWVDAYDLEYIEGNKAAVYSSRSGHASFPHPGVYLQGSSRFGIGIRNDAAQSNLLVDSSNNYKVVAAEYLSSGVVEPRWVNYMREWGPKVVYNSRVELEKVIGLLPFTIRFSVEDIFNRFPTELYGEEGPTGPKEKNNWVGDERG